MVTIPNITMSYQNQFLLSGIILMNYLDFPAIPVECPDQPSSLTWDVVENNEFFGEINGEAKHTQLSS